uniref:ABC transporter domain-containing protein n=1 Tax=Acrobeloides nanus TaxID=290746 RepID=A0A914DIK1_9BILA
MPSNELSEVGERGVALSGGQRARISLARALYQNRDVYLMDDIFSSIDKNVADKIFQNALKDLLTNKTVLLVTSNPEYLSKCDRVVFLEHGRILEIETHAKLIEISDLYKNFVNEFHKSGMVEIFS